MSLNNPLQTIATSLYCALHKDLSDGLTEGDVVIYVFPQLWGSTALGFGGVGGQSMTNAYTVCVEDVNVTGREVAVYFGGRFAGKLVQSDKQQARFYQQCLRNQNFPEVGKWQQEIAKM